MAGIASMVRMSLAFSACGNSDQDTRSGWLDGTRPVSSSMAPHRPICRAVAREIFVTEVRQPGRRSTCGTLVGRGQEGSDTMRVESVKDVGTTCIMRLPLATA